jgi:hypothetical protein
MSYMLQEKLESNEDLFVATVNLLTSAAHYQVEIIYIVNLIIGISLFFWRRSYKFTCNDTIFG